MEFAAKVASCFVSLTLHENFLSIFEALRDENDCWGLLKLLDGFLRTSKLSQGFKTLEGLKSFSLSGLCFDHRKARHKASVLATTNDKNLPRAPIPHPFLLLRFCFSCSFH